MQEHKSPTQQALSALALLIVCGFALVGWCVGHHLWGLVAGITLVNMALIGVSRKLTQEEQEAAALRAAMRMQLTDVAAPRKTSTERMN